MSANNTPFIPVKRITRTPSQSAESVTVKQPIKTAQMKPNGINLQGVLLSCFAEDSTKKQKTPRQIAAEQAGQSAGKKKAYIRNSVIFKPTNVHQLVQAWLDASPEQRDALPYVPVPGRDRPTIAIRMSSDPSDQKYRGIFFLLPTESPEFWIEQDTELSFSLFGRMTITPGRSLATVVSFTFAPSVKEPQQAGGDFDEEGPSTRTYTAKINNRQYEVVFFASCTSIAPSSSSLDVMPREYIAQALFYNPLFSPIKLGNVMDVETGGLKREGYKPQVYVLPLVMEPSDTVFNMPSRLFEPVVAKAKILELPSEESSTGFAQRRFNAGDLIGDEEYVCSDNGLTFNTACFRQKDNGMFTNQKDPETFCYDDKKAAASSGSMDPSHELPKKVIANAQIRFEQWSADSSPETEGDGVMRLALFEESIAHAGVMTEFGNLMSRLPIPVTVVAQINGKNTIKLQENKEFGLRKEKNAPIGIFEMRQLFSAWHVIEFCRQFGIPVTLEWVQKTFDPRGDKNRRLRFKLPPGKKSDNPAVNNARGGHYGFVNLTEYTEYDIDDFLVPEAGWSYVVLMDFDYANMSDTDKETFHSLTPSQGILVIDGQSLPGGKKLDIVGRNIGGNGKGGIVIAYKYDPAWVDKIEQFKKEQIAVISDWRKKFSDQNTLDLFTEATHVYHIQNPGNKQVNTWDGKQSIVSLMGSSLEQDYLAPKSLRITSQVATTTATAPTEQPADPAPPVAVVPSAPPADEEMKAEAEPEVPRPSGKKRPAPPATAGADGLPTPKSKKTKTH